MMIAGILVSGGGGAKRSVELLRGDGSSCSLPDLPGDRSSHSQAGWLTCGGFAPAARQIELSNESSRSCTVLGEGPNLVMIFVPNFAKVG